MCNAVPGQPQPETCDNMDNDCDGSTDEDFTNLGTSCTMGVGECQAAGLYVCKTDGSATECNANAGTPTTETCDGKDNDCDGQTDEDVKTTYYQDADGDTYGDAADPSQACSAPVGYVSDNTDCDDTAASCTTDCASLKYADADSDAFGNLAVSHRGCDAPGGYVSGSADCDDVNAQIHPGATETCNGIDDNCDGLIDEGGACPSIVYYCDQDGDTYRSSDITGTCNSYNCVPSGCITTPGDDCEDINAAIHPGATEVCDGIDNDCSALTADGSGESWYGQSTTCGLGICAGSAGVLTCQASKQVDTCNPYAGAVPESCDDKTGYDGSDNNCDGTVDLNCNSYCDQDGDGYTTHLVCLFAGKLPGDCDDSSADINPGKEDIPCDAIDQDCSGTAFQGTDNDGDTFKTEGGLCGNVDCDDTLPNIYPELTESQQCLGSSILCPGTQQRTCQIDGTFTSWTTCDFSVSNSQSCSDINACTANDVCSEGICIGNSVTCQLAGSCDGLNKVWTGTCDPFIGCTVQDAPIETCNGQDDDCDNTADEYFPTIGTQCTNGVGACEETGTMVCTPNGQGTECNAVSGTPSQELCDAALIDQDCDGAVNEECECVEGQTKSCGQSNIGECRLGTQTCDINGNWGQCIAAVYPSAESCDGKDNDCNGQTDESLADITTDVYGYDSIGECQVQIESCLGGSYQIIQQAIGPKTEICDGKDNNCNGQTDEVDNDQDGFNDCNGQDKCTGLILPQRPAAFVKLNPNSYALESQIGYGCSGEEILAFCKTGDTLGQYKYGVSPGTYKNWLNQRGWAVEPECQMGGKVT